eukprot:scaffold48809_cov75-Phaeocystis_antarctica.AAC.7
MAEVEESADHLLRLQVSKLVEPRLHCGFEPGMVSAGSFAWHLADEMGRKTCSTLAWKLPPPSGYPPLHARTNFVSEIQLQRKRVDCVSIALREELQQFDDRGESTRRDKRLRYS